MSRKQSIVRVVCALALCLYLMATMVFMVSVADSLKTLADAMHPFRVYVSLER
jgi:Co/Zn/Cd efflux system component